MQALVVRVRYIFMLALFYLLSSLQAESATLRTETNDAWNDYVEHARGDMQRRVRPGGTFLWAFEDAKRGERVRRGEIVVGRIAKKNADSVPGGSIHHWAGAMFMPNASISDVDEVTRDYDRYKEFYRPSVIDSKLIERTALEDKFSMLLMNKALFLQTALEAEYQVDTVRVDARHLYSISKTTRVQEIKDFGSPDEQRIAEGQGSGYIWKLFSMIRFEQRDGGVYVEVEVMALSRDIPAAVRFFAEPIIRNVSRNSLLVSLQQTQQAVRGQIASIHPTPLPTGSAGFLEAH